MLFMYGLRMVYLELSWQGMRDQRPMLFQSSSSPLCTARSRSHTGPSTDGHCKGRSYHYKTERTKELSTAITVLHANMLLAESLLAMPCALLCGVLAVSAHGISAQYSSNSLDSPPDVHCQEA